MAMRAAILGATKRQTSVEFWPIVAAEKPVKIRDSAMIQT
jgi:hypothetical protein